MVRGVDERKISKRERECRKFEYNSEQWDLAMAIMC